MESKSPKPHGRSSETFIFLVVYPLSLIVMYFTTLPPEETKDFTGRIAKEFSIAGIVKTSSPKSPKYKVFNLKDLDFGEIHSPGITSGITFLLPEKAITINNGNIHHAEIREDHGEWQLVAFKYSNTHTSISTYRAYKDRIEPVSYKVTSHIGQAYMAVMLFIPAVIVSVILAAILNWRARRAIRDENDYLLSEKTPVELRLARIVIILNMLGLALGVITYISIGNFNKYPSFFNLYDVSLFILGVVSLVGIARKKPWGWKAVIVFFSVDIIFRAYEIGKWLSLHTKDLSAGELVTLLTVLFECVLMIFMFRPNCKAYFSIEQFQ